MGAGFRRHGPGQTHASMAPAISVVLPVHNAAATVARAVASVQAQTFADWELLAVDDGSTDATRQTLLELAESDPRIRVLDIARAGIVAALNAGLAASTAPFIARMDADDEAYAGRLAAQHDYLLTHPDIGVASCLVDFGGDRAESEGYARHVDWLNSLITPEQISLNRFVERDVPPRVAGESWRIPGGGLSGGLRIVAPLAGCRCANGESAAAAAALA